MKQISIDNGNSFSSIDAAIAGIGFDAIVGMMDDEIREAVHTELAPCTEAEFLARYLELSTVDLVIG